MRSVLGRSSGPDATRRLKWADETSTPTIARLPEGVGTGARRRLDSRRSSGGAGDRAAIPGPIPARVGGHGLSFTGSPPARGTTAAGPAYPEARRSFTEAPPLPKAKRRVVLGDGAIWIWNLADLSLRLGRGPKPRSSAKQNPRFREIWLLCHRDRVESEPHSELDTVQTR